MQKLASNSPQPKLIIDIQSPSPTKMPFPMPDFSVPPPNFANVGAKVPTPGLFMPVSQCIANQESWGKLGISHPINILINILIHIFTLICSGL